MITYTDCKWHNNKAHDEDGVDTGAGGEVWDVEVGIG